MSVYCYRCGQRLANGARHCPGCGAAIFYDETGLREDYVRRSASASPSMDDNAAQAYSEHKTYEGTSGIGYDDGAGSSYEGSSYGGTSYAGASSGESAGSGGGYGGSAYNGASYNGSSYSGSAYNGASYSPYGDPRQRAAYTAPAASRRDGTARSAMVCGIVGLVFAMIFPFVGLPLSIAAIVMGALGLKSELRRGMAVAGLVTGIIGFVLNALILAAAIYYVLNPDLLERLLEQANSLSGLRR